MASLARPTFWEGNLKFSQRQAMAKCSRSYFVYSKSPNILLYFSTANKNLFICMESKEVVGAWVGAKKMCKTSSSNYFLYASSSPNHLSIYTQC